MCSQGAGEQHKKPSLGGRVEYVFMAGLSKNLALLLLGFWLGCAVLFALIITPTLFNPEVASGLSKEMAGAIAGAILRRIYLITYVCIGLAAVFLFIAFLGEARAGKGLRYALGLCILVLALNAVSHLWILDKIYKIKLEINNSLGPDSVALSEKFKWWHKTSTIVYGSAVVCGALGAIALLLPGGKTKKFSR